MVDTLLTDIVRAFFAGIQSLTVLLGYLMMTHSFSLFKALLFYNLHTPLVPVTLIPFSGKMFVQTIKVLTVCNDP